jgi:hypothetical protein
VKHLRDIFALNNRETWLFHGSSHVIENDILRPSETDTIDSENGLLLCGTENLTSAALYALKTPKMKTIQSTWDKKDQRYLFALIEGREEFLRNFRGGNVFILPKEEFTRRWPDNPNNNEWTTTNSFRVNADNSFAVPDIESVLATGAQVFFIREGSTIEDILEQNRLRAESGKPTYFEDIIASPHIIWENRERGIYPLPGPAFMKA